MRNFNNDLNNTITKQRYGTDKSVFSQKSKMLSMRASQKMQPSVFGKPTFRDADAVRDIWRTTDERKSFEVGPANPLSDLVDEMMQDNSKAKLATLPVVDATEVI